MWRSDGDLRFVLLSCGGQEARGLEASQSAKSFAGRCSTASIAQSSSPKSCICTTLVHFVAPPKVQVTRHSAIAASYATENGPGFRVFDFSSVLLGIVSHSSGCCVLTALLELSISLLGERVLETSGCTELWSNLRVSRHYLVQ